MMTGQFITLEGIDGAGKTVNTHYIQSLLKNKGIAHLLSREPGGTVLSENIRQLLVHQEQEAMTEQAELLLMFAARSQHIKLIIKPALEKNIWVISDRFTDATYAYQGGGRHIDRSIIQRLENFVQGNLRPNLTLLLDAPVEIGMQRVQQRGNVGRFELEGMAFLKKVRQSYLTIAQQQPERVKIVDATQTLENVQIQIKQILAPLID